MNVNRIPRETHETDIITSPFCSWRNWSKRAEAMCSVSYNQQVTDQGNLAHGLLNSCSEGNAFILKLIIYCAPTPFLHPPLTHATSHHSARPTKVSSSYTFMTFLVWSGFWQSYSFHLSPDFVPQDLAWQIINGMFTFHTFPAGQGYDSTCQQWNITSSYRLELSNSRGGHGFEGTWDLRQWPKRFICFTFLRVYKV